LVRNENINNIKIKVMEESRMKKHVTIVGALQIGFSSLWLILAVVLFFIFNFARSQVGDDDTALRVLGFLSISLPLFIGVISLLGLISGIALLSYKGWGRIITIIVSALGCFNIPIGTLVGVYSIWVLMQDDTVKLFNHQ
jgi:hypothetical protein